MKLVENTLNNSLTCKNEISDKTLANCSPYFTALIQVINKLETQRSYKTKVNPENLKLEQTDLSSGFKIIRLFV